MLSNNMVNVVTTFKLSNNMVNEVTTWYVK